MRQLLVIALTLVVMGSSLAAYATGSPAPAAAPIAEPEVTETDTTPTFDDKKYVDPTYPNLAMLYWSLGLLDINNAQHIDNFLAITECNMYLTYVNNDLEWREVREATRAFLQKNYKSFPTSFKITIPIYLGRYDPDLEIFEVNTERSAINAVRNIETIYYTKQITCGLGEDLVGYPRNLILYLNRPFILSEVPVEMELARLFMDEANSKNSRRAMDANRRQRTEDSERMAYLELFFRVHSFKENKNTMGGFLKAVVYSQIDYIRVYADYDKYKLLYEKDMYEDESRKRRRRTEGITQEELQLPDGPLMIAPKKKEEPKKAQ